MKPHNRIQKFIEKINNPTSYELRPFELIVSKIKEKENLLKNLSDEKLKELSLRLKSNFNKSFEEDTLLIEAYALVKEVCKRKLNLNPYDVQLTGAVALFNNRIIEMQTGEGKTLTAVFPAFLNALSGKGVHILTFNDYLAKRDAEWMAPVYNFLGLTVSFVTQNMSREQKRKAYNCDITYATAKEVGYDYLRSTISYEKEDNVLRPFNFAIVDEADAILIDEARNPLVLAGNIIDSNLNFYKVAEFAKVLNPGEDYDTDEYSRNIFLTELGINKAEEKFKVQNLMEDKNLGIHSAINLALQAKEFLKKDIDYIIRDGRVKLIDEFTGRIVEDRKWRNGLQTAVEAKEKLKINSEGIVLNSLTLQHLVQKYPQIGGMTATAHQSAEEFLYFYKKATVVIPPNKKCIRKDLPDRLFKTKKEKLEALLKHVKKIHLTGQPILIGTLTVKESEELAKLFRDNQIFCEVLNAKNDELEAKTIANAGKLGAVTISTNMAGRGTDILLGGKERISRDEIIELGGLYVIGTNKHESSRIDNQLRGRAGRQGDIGISEFFISMEDDLMIRYKLQDSIPKKINKLTQGNKKTNILLDTINHIQRVIEGQMFDIRRTLYDYSNIIEKQRVILHNERSKILEEYYSKKLSIMEENGFLEAFSSAQLPLVKDLILFQYDKHWANHLDYLSEVREGIHFLRLGGQNPLREFQKMADKKFQSTFSEIDSEIENYLRIIIKKDTVDLSELGIKKPSSTWTYIINDYAFGNRLGLMLLDSANIGMQVNPLAVFIIFMAKVSGLFKAKNVT